MTPQYIQVNTGAKEINQLNPGGPVSQDRYQQYEQFIEDDNRLATVFIDYISNLKNVKGQLTT